MRSFKNSEHINEKKDGPYRGFCYLSLFSDPLNMAKWSQRDNNNFATFNRIVETKTSIIQTGQIYTRIRAVAGQRSSPDLCFAAKSIKI